MNSAFITAAANLAGLIDSSEAQCVPLILPVAVGHISEALTALVSEPAQPDATMTFVASLQDRIDKLEALVTALQAPAPLHPVM